MKYISLLAVFLATALTACSQPKATLANPRLTTRWSTQVDAANPWPEYPRPALIRSDWLNLNGPWQYELLEAGTVTDQGTILVPFPIESALSGVNKRVSATQTLRYTRTFRVPQAWTRRGDQVRLNIGACDWSSRVIVNGTLVGTHQGGYDPFSFDLAAAIKPGDNTLIVEVTDPGNSGGQPRGKQWDRPHGIWYTPTTGLWQTIWLEPVPAANLLQVTASADFSTNTITINPAAANLPATHRIVAKVREGSSHVASATVSATQPGQIPLAAVKHWSPDRPAIYDIDLSLIDGAGSQVDRASTYVAFRDVRLGKDAAGINRILLNGTPCFMFGPLDQGFWPDGLYTPATIEAMRFDLEATKQMGCNMLRKHVKVEPQIFYSMCDRMGLMVWQDMPSPFFEAPKWDDGFPPLTDAWKQNFESELTRMIETHRQHPSIVMWVPFNEGWGQNDLAWSARVVDQVKKLDPTRLVNCASGWTDTGNGDVLDVHIYPGPGGAPLQPDRAVVLGEFGGLGLPMDGHTWASKDNWGYVSYKTREELTDAYVKLIEALPLHYARGVNAAVYTQTSDVEIECNGWLTYDREIWKIDAARASRAAQPLYAPPPVLKPLVPSASSGAPGPKWKFTLTQPGEGWMLPSFNDASWSIGAAGFGKASTPGANIGTPWETPRIWLRRTVQVPAMQSPMLEVHHDEDAKIYINGILAASLAGYTSSYQLIGISSEARAQLIPGTTITIAVECTQTTGGQYIDVGLMDLVGK
jgi:hypothetical protein